MAEAGVEAAFIGRDFALGIHKTADGSVVRLQIGVPGALRPDCGALANPILTADKFPAPDVFWKLAELLACGVDAVSACACACLAVVLYGCGVAGCQVSGAAGESSVGVANSGESGVGVANSGESGVGVSNSGESWVDLWAESTSVYQSSGMTRESGLSKSMLAETLLAKSLLAESLLSESWLSETVLSKTLLSESSLSRESGLSESSTLSEPCLGM